jgi:hypothetical protein
VLLCVGYATANCTIMTHKEEELVAWICFFLEAF